jgi:hypothetical protein
MPVLICNRITYFSPGDEKSFFEWLNRIKAVRRWYGSGDSLFLHVPSKISVVGYRELDALFRRYMVDRKQLVQLTSKAAPRGSAA